MIDSPAEIVRSYRMAADPKKQIKVLAELNACTVKEIRQVLVGEGVLPRETEIPEEPKKAAKKRFDEETARMLYEEGLDDAAIAKATGMTAHTVAKWRSRNGLRKKVRKPRMKKNVDVPGTKLSEAAPGVQKIPIVGEAVEVTEPDFTKSAAPEPRTVTVEELRALLEDACRDGLGECAVLVEGTAFADLWLDVHSTLSCFNISLRQRVALHREKFAAIAEQAGRRNKRAAGNAGLILPLSPGEHITAVTLALKIRHDATAVRTLTKTLHFHAILPLFFVFMGYYHKIT